MEITPGPEVPDPSEFHNKMVWEQAGEGLLGSAPEKGEITE